MKYFKLSQFLSQAALLVLSAALLSACGSDDNNSTSIANDSSVEASRVITTQVTMRDGAKLETYVYLPEGDGPFPTLVNRTIYGLPISPIGGYPIDETLDEDGSTEEEKIALGWPLINERGYALVIQITRGRFNSEGIDRSWLDDANDGYDLIEWVNQQEWSNGKIGIFGDSAVGVSALQAAAAAPPSLDALYVQVAPGNPFGEDFMPENGASKIESLLLQGASIAFDTSPSHWAGMGLSEDEVNLVFEESNEYLGELFSSLDDPVSSAAWTALPLGADKSIGSLMPFWNAMYDANTEATYREQLDVAGKINIPTFMATLWQDVFFNSTMSLYQDLEQRGVPNRLLVFNGSHYEIDDPELWPEPVMLDWFDYWLNDQDNGVYTGNDVTAAIQGVSDSEPLQLRSWPPVETSELKFYLQADGRLEQEKPGQETGGSTFTYDPANPLITQGGRNLIVASGVQDQSDILDREDILLYESTVLDESLLVTGEILADLWVSSDAIDTDFVIRVLDIHEDGTANLVGENLLRMSRRNGRELAEYVLPNEPLNIQLSTKDIAHQFAAGHKIGLLISSSSFPAWDRNLNNGLSSFSGNSFITANNTVYTNKQRASYIKLPVLSQ